MGDQQIARFGALRFSPDILRRLGEELIPNPEQGIIELVKNAYDADANYCEVSLHNVKRSGGTITIEDNGEGMDEEDLLNGFLIIGRSRKLPRKRTARNRLPVGDKGLGRLAAMRLGSKVVVRSRPRHQPNVELVMEIDWTSIDDAPTVESVQLAVSRKRTEKESGVTIEIHQLRNSFEAGEARRLARELLLLSDPFDHVRDFEARLSFPEYSDLESLVKEAYFNESAYLLEAHIDADGYGSATLHDKTGVLLYETKLPPKGGQYLIPPATFKLWIFLLGASFSSTNVKSTEVAEWLRNFGGVHVYHRGLRVRPYGDPGSDWLDMNLARAQHPEFRPSTNTSIGRVDVEDPQLLFEQPTNRIGFVENETFSELRRFARETYDWAASERLSTALEARREIKAAAPAEAKETLEKVRQLIQHNVPREARKPVEQALSQFVIAQKKEVVALQDDLQLYRSLATAGTTSSVFAHESAKPISLIQSAAETIKRRGTKLLGDRYEGAFQEVVEGLEHISSSLRSYTQFPIYHLKRSKRVFKSVDVCHVWQDTVNLFQPLLLESNINIESEFDQQPIYIRGSEALVESIATNFITNSVHALTKPEAPLDERKISVTIRVEPPWVAIVHTDNGPGIQRLSLQEVWLPGKSTNLQGTGFGLTIVRDSVADLRGEISVEANGEMGGAMFRVLLPLEIK